MLTFISGLVVAVLGAIPTFLSVGSGARRQLALINAEAEAIKNLPTDGAGRALLTGQLDQSVERYCASRTHKSDKQRMHWTQRVPWIVISPVVFISAAIGATGFVRLTTDDPEGFVGSLSQSQGTWMFLVGTVVYIGAGFVVGSRIIRNRRVSRTEWESIADSISSNALQSRMDRILRELPSEEYQQHRSDIGEILRVINLRGPLEADEGVPRKSGAKSSESNS